MTARGGSISATLSFLLHSDQDVEGESRASCHPSGHQIAFPFGRDQKVLYRSVTFKVSGYEVGGLYDHFATRPKAVLGPSKSQGRQAWKGLLQTEALLFRTVAGNNKLG
jgi:hypothetical protein